MFSNEIQIQLYIYDIDISFSYVGNSCRDSPQYRGIGYFILSQHPLNFTFWQHTVLDGNMPVANSCGTNSCVFTARRHVDSAVILTSHVCGYK